MCFLQFICLHKLMNKLAARYRVCTHIEIRWKLVATMIREDQNIKPLKIGETEFSHSIWISSKISYT